MAEAAAMETRAEFVPTRVIINAEGEAISAGRAAERGIKPEVIFVRNDGWTLGATLKLMDVARATWRGQWVEQWVLNGGTGKWEKRWPLPEGRL